MSHHDTALSEQRRTVIDSPTPFEFDDIFYSRTDHRGVILEANGQFRRISGYLWEELKGAPHKIVRHPDMPKGVFHLFWERLNAGLPMVAYVKNRSKDGRYYWVIALTSPLDGGYISVRFKPSGPLFQKVQDIYADMRSAEQGGASPADSARMLSDRIIELGFPTLDAFFGVALADEYEKMAAQINRPTGQVNRRFRDMHETIQKVSDETASLAHVIKAIRTVPMNMRILATRLENAGGPISAISVNYGSMLDEMSTWVDTFREGDQSPYRVIYDAITEGMFLMNAASVQRQMCERFDTDLQGAANKEQLYDDRETLQSISHHYEELAASATRRCEREVRRFSRSVLDMKRFVTGLSSARMMCKIESAALHGTGDSSLAGIVNQLDAGQEEIERHLSRIVEMNTAIQSHVGMIKIQP